MDTKACSKMALKHGKYKKMIDLGRLLTYLMIKAMKSSPLLGPFVDSEFWGFSLLKIYIGWVL